MFHWTFSVPPSIYRHSSLIFGEKYLPQRVCVLEGGAENYLAEYRLSMECRLNMQYPYVGHPLASIFCFAFVLFSFKKSFCDKRKNA